MARGPTGFVPGAVSLTAARGRRVSAIPKLRIVVELLRPTARLIPWRILAGSMFGAVVLVSFLTRQVQSIAQPIGALRSAAVVLAMGASFVLDDPAEGSIDHLPVSRLVRRTVRTALALPALALGWFLALQIAPSSQGAAVPVAALTLEYAGIVALATAAAAALAPYTPEGLGGVAAGPATLLLLGAAFALSHKIPFFVSEPGDPRWTASHHGWLVALVGLVLAAGWLSRDPWRRLKPHVGSRSRESRTRPAPRPRSGTRAR
jgi:hypothetical protein